MAYYLLSRKPVFEGKTLVEVCGSHLHEEPAPLAARAVTVWCAEPHHVVAS